MKSIEVGQRCLLGMLVLSSSNELILHKFALVLVLKVGLFTLMVWFSG